MSVPPSEALWRKPNLLLLDDLSQATAATPGRVAGVHRRYEFFGPGTGDFARAGARCATLTDDATLCIRDRRLRTAAKGPGRESCAPRPVRFARNRPFPAASRCARRPAVRKQKRAPDA
jgi:hypothetical protein